MEEKTSSNKGKKEITKLVNSLHKLEVQYVDVNSIRPNNYNPNRESEFEFDLLLRSMKEDGFTSPVICQKDGTIVDGEHRWRASRQLGYKEIPVVFVNMTEEQMRIATLRHNRARGSEDVELTIAVLKDLEKLGALEWAKDSLKLSDQEMTRLMEDIPVAEALAGIDFSQAWEPASREENATTTLRESSATSGTVVEAMTNEGYDLIRRRQEAIRLAKSEQDRIQIQKEMGLYRFNLTFSNEEGVLIKQVLGDQPAIRLVKLCRLVIEKNLMVDEIAA